MFYTRVCASASVEHPADTRVGVGLAAHPHSVSETPGRSRLLGSHRHNGLADDDRAGAAGVISPNFFLFVTTIGVMVS